VATTTVQARSPNPITPAPAAPRPKADLGDWLAVPRQRKLAIGVVIGLLVVAAVAYLWISSARRKEVFGSRAVQSAREAAEAGNLPLAASELQRVMQTYSGTRAAVEAMLVLNQVRMVNGQTELAVVGLREFLAKNPPIEYRVPAEGLLGVALENTKKPLEAAAAYQQAAAGATVEYLRAEYTLQAARTLQDGGKQAEAIAAYKKVVDSFPKSPAFTEAQVRLGEISKGQ
jgi:outer membrane protein assembly factor BamD (BamD/ComL family)